MKMEYFKTKKLSLDSLIQIAKALELEFYEKGSYICRQGEVGYKCYIILDGELSVQIENKEKANEV